MVPVWGQWSSPDTDLRIAIPGIGLRDGIVLSMYMKLSWILEVDSLSIGSF